MGSLLSVLIVILGAAGFLNYRKIVIDADSILAILRQNDGNFPADEDPEDYFLPDEEPPDDDRLFSPELPYETRYFSVFLTGSGTPVTVNTERIAAIDTQAAAEYAQLVFKGSSYKGFVGDYRYIRYPLGGEIHIIFLDYGRELNSFRTFMAVGLVVGLIGLSSVLLLLTVLSGRIVKPFYENYEKQKRFITDAGHEPSLLRPR